MGAGKGTTKRMQSVQLKDLLLQEEQLNTNKRLFVKENSDNWQAIPWLSALADGRQGYNDEYCRAYSERIWSIRTGGSEYPADVNLVISELGAADKTLPRIYISGLNANNLVNYLIKEIAVPANADLSIEKVRRWRYENLLALHKQDQPMPEIAEQAIKKEFPYFPEYKRSRVILSDEDVDELEF